MNAQQRAVIAAAKKDGMMPMEMASELLCHDLMESILTQLRKRQVAFTKMSEQEQDAFIAELESDMKKAVSVAARVINAQGVETVGAKLKALKIDGKLTATMIIEGDEPNRHVLTDKAHDKSDILIVLYPNSYAEGMDVHVGDKDQKDLPLEGDADIPASGKKTRAPKAKAEDKPIELPPKLIEDARDFVTIQQNASLAAIQNQFRVGYQKAEAILKALESEGVVKFVGTDQAGQYELVRSAPVVTTEQGEKVDIDPETAKVFYATAVKAVMKAGSADDSVMRAIYGDDDNAIEVALMAMEEDGIVSAPSPEGLRDVLVLPGKVAE